jgi:uncharacterized protein
MRLIVLIVLVVIAVWLVRRALRSSAIRKDNARREPQVKPGDLVRCSHCGLHLPRAEARQVEGALFCSEEHARLGRR